MLSPLSSISQQLPINITPDIVLELIEVPGGPFKVGEGDNILEGTLDTFWLGKYPVTNAQYLAFIEATGLHTPEWMEEGSDYNIYSGQDGHYKQLGEALTHPQHPVVGVSWDDAIAFCKWLSQETGFIFGLPSEVQWEYAARSAKIDSPFTYAGGHRLEELGWFYQNSHGATKPVGLKLPNGLGLYDMSGNVWEWCADHWHQELKETPANGAAYEDENETAGRVVRGGSWGNYNGSCRVSLRFNDDLSSRNYFFGFRLARYQPPQR